MIQACRGSGTFEWTLAHEEALGADIRKFNYLSHRGDLFLGLSPTDGGASRQSATY